MKKMFLCLLVFGICGIGLARNEINKQNEAQVLKTAENKSKTVYDALVRLEDVGLRKTPESNRDCRVINAKYGHVECSITDIDEDSGWTEGLVVTWDVEHAGADNEIFWFAKVERIEH